MCYIGYDLKKNQVYNDFSHVNIGLFATLHTDITLNLWRNSFAVFTQSDLQCAEAVFSVQLLI